ncbi:MAG: porin [Planctomycetota bacterium]|nr:porin [Planctomycetota bacterium]
MCGAKAKWWGLFGCALALSACAVARGGEAGMADLMAQIQAMREAYESRIANLETQVKTLTSQRDTAVRETKIQEGIDKALGSDPDRTPISERFFSSASTSVRSATDMTIGGYTEFTYVDRGDTISRFDQLRTILEFGAQLHENIQFYMELEYEHGAVISGPGTTEGELELEQAWVDFKVLDELVFRAGQILVPTSRYNLYHEAWTNNFVDRPLISRRITPTTWWEEGVGFHGQLLDTDAIGIEYEAYLFNPGRADRISVGGGLRSLRLNGDAPIYDSKKAGAFRVAFEPARSASWLADHLEIGIGGYFSGFDGAKGLFDDDGDPNTPDVYYNADAGTVQIWSADLTFERGDFGFRGEAAMAHAPAGRTVGGEGQQAFGFYTEAYYSFWPSFINSTPFGKDTYKDPKLVAAVRFDYVDLALDNFDQRDLRRLTLGLSYRPIPRTVFKFDYQMDWSPSTRQGTTLSESGANDETDAFLFSVAVGF